VLIDYPSYARWNSFMREASGEVGVGKTLNVKVHLSSGSKTSFKPKLLVVDKNRELRWAPGGNPIRVGPFFPSLDPMGHGLLCRSSDDVALARKGSLCVATNGR
jgi:hypothetical protein